jgi:pilus assembly protein Flp/PilA
MRGLLKRFGADVSGAAAVEYGLIAAGLSMAIVTVLQGIGARLSMTSDGVQVSMR